MNIYNCLVFLVDFYTFTRILHCRYINLKVGLVRAQQFIKQIHLLNVMECWVGVYTETIV